MPQENVQADPVLLTHLLNETIDKRLDILRRVADVGSISEAARGAGVSYKAAWQAIETLSNLAGGPLVEKVVGGRSGGGTRITSRGEEVLRLNEALVRARRMAVIYERLSHYRIRTGTSAMDNKDRHALDFLEALALFRGQLADAGLLDAYRVAYDRWALGSMVYNLNSLRDVASFSQVFRKLRAGGLERLGLLREPEEAFDNELDRRSLDLVRAGNESAYLFFWLRNHVVFGDDAHDVFDLVESQRDGAFAERDAARADLDRAREELGRMREELARERDARERVEKDLYDVRRSAEYRYGTAMLRPARAVKNRLDKRK